MIYFYNLPLTLTLINSSEPIIIYFPSANPIEFLFDLQPLPPTIGCSTPNIFMMWPSFNFVSIY